MSEFDPQVWWSCPLDVEGLAWASVSRACAAARELASTRGCDLVFDTRPDLVAASFAAIRHLRVGRRKASPWGELSGFFAVSDGWVRLHANYPHHAAALRSAYGANDRGQLAARLVGESREDVEQLVGRLGGIAVAVRSEREWAGHPQHLATAQDPWVTRHPGEERPAPFPSARLPLTGVRVLDLTRVIAGPTCSQLLACLGADVLRLDPPGRPELLDQYLATGMGKRSAVVDLGRATDAVHGLLPAADVVIDGYRPGALARFGLDPAALRERYPCLVVASLSAWGEHGPWAQRRGFDSIVQAASGIAMVCADGDRPGALPVQALDHASGYVMAAEVMEMLARGEAGVVTVSLLGAARTLLAAPRRRPTTPAPLPMPTVSVSSPHGVLRVVPPPVLAAGATIERSVSGYGRARPAWQLDSRA